MRAAYSSSLDESVSMIQRKLLAFPTDLSPGTASLYLDDNDIAELPRALPPALRFLSLNRNAVCVIGEMGLSARLVSLSLSHNRVRSLVGLRDTPSLHATLVELELAHNCVGAAELRRLHGLRALQTLDLSHNDLDSMAPFAELELESLQQLSVSHNRISALTGLDALTSLERLDASNNQITAVAVAAAARWPALRHLDLSSNRLARVRAFARQCHGLLRAVQDLRLEHNPMQRRAAGSAGGAGGAAASPAEEARRISYRATLAHAAGPQLRNLDGAPVSTADHENGRRLGSAALAPASSPASPAPAPAPAPAAQPAAPTADSANSKIPRTPGIAQRPSGFFSRFRARRAASGARGAGAAGTSGTSGAADGSTPGAFPTSTGEPSRAAAARRSRARVPGGGAPQ
eukprot:g6627.t1